jgi:uncharacterized protein YjbI with pentapeptide repeats
MNAARKLEAWNNLIAGKSMDGLGLERTNARKDLTGLVVADPVPVRTTRYAMADVTQFADLTNVRGVRWSQIDFTRASLNKVRFWDSEISDCLFDSCSLKGCGYWQSAISRSSFRSADLRGAVLGPVSEDGKRNKFEHVDFSQADLGQSIFTSADFRSCLFKNTKLTKVDFEGSTFTDCVFEGDLEEVSFSRNAYQAPNIPPNEMLNVDFSRARLMWVEFRGLDLENVIFPQDEDHIVIDDYPKKLDRILAALRGRKDTASRAVAAGLAVSRKWVGPNQKRGILNKNEIREYGGEEILSTVLNLLD